MNRSVFALPLVLAVVACTAAPVEDAESSDDALKKLDANGELGPIKPKKPPVKDPPGLACGLKNPSCQVTPSSAEIDWLSPEDNAVRIELGCQPAFHYLSGANAGFLGGILSKCPDTKAVRARFNLGYGSDFCDKCIPPAGTGKVYVFWSAFVGPNCPSGCNMGEPPLW